VPVETALTQLKSLTRSSPQVDVLDGPAGLPAALSALLLRRTAFDVTSELRNITDGVESDALSNESRLVKTPGHNKVENWASGGAPFARFNELSVTTYVDSLFGWVAAHLSSKYDGELVLSRNNLFHGHLVFETFGASPDLLLVFHAFEYPGDLETAKSRFAMTLEPLVPFFNSSAPAYRWRNVLWSMRLNKLWFIHYEDNSNPYRDLLADPDVSKNGNPLFLDESKLGTRVADLNTFPNEGVRAFLRIW
jgi:hypothetical protein